MSIYLWFPPKQAVFPKLQMLIDRLPVFTYNLVYDNKFKENC